MKRVTSWVMVMLLAVGMGVAAGCNRSGNVAKFTGRGSAQTPAFTVEGQWQLQAEYIGPGIRAMLYDEYGDKVGHTFTHSGGRQTIWPYPDGGTYRLEVTCEDHVEWTMTVIDLE